MSISREILLACALLALAAAARAAAAPAAPSAARGQARLTASALPGRTLSTHDPDLASYDPDAPGDYRPVDEEYDYDYAEGGDETIWCCQNAIEGCTECEERDGDYEEVDYAAEAARAEKVAAAVDDDVTAALEGCAGTAVQGGTGAYFKSDADLGKDPTSNFVRYAQGCAYEIVGATECPKNCKWIFVKGWTFKNVDAKCAADLARVIGAKADELAEYCSVSVAPAAPVADPVAPVLKPTPPAAAAHANATELAPVVAAVVANVTADADAAKSAGTAARTLAAAAVASAALLL